MEFAEVVQVSDQEVEDRIDWLESEEVDLVSDPVEEGHTR